MEIAISAELLLLRDKAHQVSRIDDSTVINLVRDS